MQINAESPNGDQGDIELTNTLNIDPACIGMQKEERKSAQFANVDKYKHKKPLFPGADDPEEKRRSEIAMSCLSMEDRIFERYTRKRESKINNRQHNAAPSHQFDKLKRDKTYQDVLSKLQTSKVLEIPQSDTGYKYRINVEELGYPPFPISPKETHLESKLKTVTKSKWIIKKPNAQVIGFYTKLIYHILEVVINILGCVMFIIEDYYERNKPVEDIEFFLTAFFILEFIINLYSEPRPRYSYLVSWNTLIDLLTIIPPLIDYIIIEGHSYNSISIGFLRILRVLRIMRILKLLKIMKTLPKDATKDEQTASIINPYKRQLLIAFLTLISVVFVSAGIVVFVQSLDSNAFSMDDMHFFDAVYFIMATAATVGYGDIYAQSETARILVVMFILVIIYIFTNQISEISEMAKRNNFYDIQYDLKDHIVVFQTIKVRALFKFLIHYYKEAKYYDVKFLIVGHRRITEKMVQLIRWPLFVNKVCYLSVEVFDTDTLKKACIERCKSVLFLSDANSEDPSIHDRKLIFIARFIQNIYEEKQLYLQLATTHELFLKKVSIRSKGNIPSVISVNLLRAKYKMLSKAIFNPGLLPLLLSLIVPLPKPLNDVKMKGPLMFSKTAQYRITSIPMPDECEGKKFKEIVKIVSCLNNRNQSKGGVILIGIELKSQAERKVCTVWRSQILLNPTDLRFLKDCNGIFLTTEDDISLKAMVGVEMKKYPNFDQSYNIIRSNQKNGEIKSIRTVSLEPRSTKESIQKSKSGEKYMKLPLFTKKSTSFPHLRDIQQYIANNTKFTQQQREQMILSQIGPMIKKKFNYYVNLSQNTYSLYSRDLRAHIKHHILVLGYSKGVQFLVSSIRDDSDIPIAFVNEEDLTLQIQILDQKYNNIYFFNGSCMDESHLKFANISEAAHVIILSTHSEIRGIIDANTILTSRLIKQSFPSVKCITIELRDIKCLRFLDGRPIKDQAKKLSNFYWPLFMNGEVLEGDIFDQFIHIYMNEPVLARVIMKLAGLKYLKTKEKKVAERQGSFQRSNVHGDHSSMVKSKHALSFQIPPYYYQNKKTYEELFNDLLESELSLITIGLFRAPKKHNPQQRRLISRLTRTFRGNHIIPSYEEVDMTNMESRVVFINPKPSTKLKEGDYVLVIGNIPDKKIVEYLQLIKERSQKNIESMQNNKLISMKEEEDKQGQSSMFMSNLKHSVISRPFSPIAFSKNNTDLQTMIDELKRRAINRTNLKFMIKQNKNKINLLKVEREQMKKGLRISHT